MKTIAKWAAIAVVLLLAIGLIFIFSLPSGPHSARDVRLYTSLLNEIAAVDVPHNSFLSDEQKTDHADLLALVESGKQLTEQQSRTYRQLIQQILLDHQSRLVWLDTSLTVMNDVEIDEVNNVGGTGIEGLHDHHDQSARRNFSDLSVALQRLETANGITAPVVRIFSANRAYKNLTDIILHLAVAAHSVSVEYMPPDLDVEPGTMAADFESMLMAYKIAQFAPVNSQTYVAQIGRAMDAYDRLVLAAQARINQRLSPLERRLAGRWLALHTIAPQPDTTMTVRFPR
ncbi:MAG: hypothetical protein NXI27_25435 [Alphaproteobacteria bacterium]|nr:hypothetical protein [Alphaproteobacteria bacterium]